VEEELMSQLCSCVQWKQSVGRIIEYGVSSFIEIGPGRVLGSLIRRIGSEPAYRERRIEVMHVGDPASARKVAEAS
jgi:[acyl-carrier-protein] S-malonyltransferase